MAKKTDNPIEKQFVFNSDNVHEIMEKQSQGYSLPRYMNPWFKNQTGVRKAGCVYGWTQHELDEFTKCAVDIHYFANNYCQIKTEDGQIRQMKLRDYLFSDRRRQKWSDRIPDLAKPMPNSSMKLKPIRV